MKKKDEVAILIILRESDMHGWGIVQKLEKWGYNCTGTIYKTLRAIEEDRLVTSYWEVGGRGPAKRTYSLTELGKENLALLISELEREHLVTTYLLKRYRKAAS